MSFLLSTLMPGGLLGDLFSSSGRFKTGRPWSAGARSAGGFKGLKRRQGLPRTKAQRLIDRIRLRHRLKNAQWASPAMWSDTASNAPTEAYQAPTEAGDVDEEELDYNDQQDEQEQQQQLGQPSLWNELAPEEREDLVHEWRNHYNLIMHNIRQSFINHMEDQFGMTDYNAAVLWQRIQSM